MWLPLLEGSLAFRLGRWLRKREILLTNKFCISTEWIKSTKSLFSVYDWEAFWFILIVVLGGENFSQNTCPTSCDTYKMFSGNKNKEMLQILEFSHLWMAGSFIFYKNTFIYLFIYSKGKVTEIFRLLVSFPKLSQMPGLSQEEAEARNCMWVAEAPGT